MKKIAFCLLVSSLFFVCHFVHSQTEAKKEDEAAKKPKIGKIKKELPNPEIEKEKRDKAILSKASLDEKSGQKLIEFIKKRTITEKEYSEITSKIEKFKDNQFSVREKAMEEIVKYGVAALSPVREALKKQTDPEVMYRCEEIQKIVEKVNSAAVTSAVLRTLARQKNEDSIETIINFIPIADNQQVLEDVKNCLSSLAIKNNDIHPLIAKRLTDESNPNVKNTLLSATIRAGNNPQIFELAKKMLVTEKNPSLRFEILMQFVLVQKDFESLFPLLDLTGELKQGYIWQIDDLVNQIAGAKAPKLMYGKTKEKMKSYTEDWKKWLKENKEKVNWNEFKYVQKIKGSIYLLESNTNPNNYNAVMTFRKLDNEQKEIFKIQQPMIDAIPLSDDTYAVADYNSIFIRDNNNEQIKQINQNANQFLSVHLLPNGKLFTYDNNGAYEYEQTGETSWQYVRPNGENNIAKVFRLSNGNNLVVIMNGTKDCVVMVDKDGKDIGKMFSLGLKVNDQFSYNFANINNDEFYASDQSTIIKYSIKENKVIWTHNLSVSHIQVLPNGNLFCTANRSNRLVELTPEKEEVWESSITSGPRMRVFRGYLR